MSKYQSLANSYQLKPSNISYETSYQRNSPDLSMHLKNIIKSEANLKLELNAKNKQITAYEKALKEKDEKNIQLNQIISQLEAKYKSVYDNYDKAKKENEDLITHMKYIENERDTSNKMIEKMKGEECQRQIEIEKKDEMILKFKDNADIMKNMKAEIDTLENKNNTLQAQNDKLNFDINSLKEEIEKIQRLNCNLNFDIEQRDNDLSNLIEIKDNLKRENQKQEEEIKSLKLYIQKIQSESTKKDNDYKNTNKQIADIQSENVNLKNDYNVLISVINDDIANISRWIENYLPVIFSPNVKLPEIVINTGVKEEKINMCLLVKTIFEAKNKIDNDIQKNIDEIKKLKFSLTNITDENYKNIQFIENLYSNLKYEIESQKYFKIKNNFTLESDYKGEIEDILAKTFSLLHNLKESNQNDQVYAMLSKENDSLKQEMCYIEQEMQNLQNENINLRNQIGLCEQLRFENKQLKNDLITKTKAFQEQQNISEETIKSLQVDKDNLVKDNITLIKDNQSLKIMMNQKNQ